MIITVCEIRIPYKLLQKERPSIPVELDSKKLPLSTWKKSVPFVDLKRSQKKFKIIKKVYFASIPQGILLCVIFIIKTTRKK